LLPHAHFTATSARGDLAEVIRTERNKLDKQIEGLLDHVVDADTPGRWIERAGGFLLQPQNSEKPMLERSMEEVNAVANSIEKQFLTQHEVLTMLSISRTTFGRVKDKMGFPKPIMLGGITMRWHRQTVEDWIAEQAEKSAA
jgi:predicted DNA-binding transcriptional regulator AlpA